MKQSTLFAVGQLPVKDEPLQRLFDDFARGKTPHKRKRAAMASEEGRDMGAVIDALQGMTERLDQVLNGNGGGKRSRSRREREDRDDGPESARETRGRGKGSGEIEGVLVPVNVPLGRSGDTLSCYLLTGPVRDERDLLDLAEEIDRGEFRRVLRVYKPKQYDNSNRGGGNYNNGGGNGYNRDRGYNDRDREYRR